MDTATRQVRRYLGGDDTARDWLIRRFSPALRVSAEHRVRRSLAGHCEPDDLVNEVWLTALPRLDSLEPRDGRYTPVILAFLRRILDFKYRNELRRMIRARRVGASAQGEFRPSRIPDDVTGQVTRAMRGEAVERLVRHVAELPHPEREIVRLRAFEQVSNRTAAFLLDLGDAACSALYRRALERLKAVFPETFIADLPDGEAD